MKNKIIKIKGFISKSELSEYINKSIDNDGGEPIILEIWKDGEDLRYCTKGCHLKMVEVSIKLLKNYKK